MMCNSDPVLNVYRKSMKPSKKNNSSEPPNQEILFTPLITVFNNGLFQVLCAKYKLYSISIFR